MSSRKERRELRVDFLGSYGNDRDFYTQMHQCDALQHTKLAGSETAEWLHSVFDMGHETKQHFSTFVLFMKQAVFIKLHYFCKCFSFGFMPLIIICFKSSSVQINLLK